MIHFGKTMRQKIFLLCFNLWEKAVEDLKRKVLKIEEEIFLWYFVYLKKENENSWRRPLIDLKLRHWLQTHNANYANRQ